MKNSWLLAYFGCLLALTNAEVTTNALYDTNFFVYNPCGESLYLSGKVHILVIQERTHGNLLS